MSITEQNKLIIEADTAKIRKEHMEENLHNFQTELGKNYSNFLDVAEALATGLGLKIVVEAKIKILS